MLKKIAILAILISMFIVGNLLASEEEPLTIHIVAQEELTWTLKIWDGVQSPWNIPGQGSEYVNAIGCQGCYYEVWALGELIQSGYLPFTNWFEIEIPITVPGEEDPEQ